MPLEPGSVIRNNPLAFFITWTTYGSWLPGDARGWTDHRGLIRTPNPRLRRIAAASLKHAPVTLGPADRDQVEQAIREHCRFRSWHLLAASCRSTHVHVVVAAENRRPDELLRSLKAWCSRRLAARVTCSTSRWSRGGSVRRLYESRDVAAVVVYVAERQDRPRDC
jgi:REP element-mobilizing transposase RayT